MSNNAGLTDAQQHMVDLWQAHVAAEFEARNVEATLDTMSEHPHVLNIPVNSAAAVGTHGVATFYRHDFFPSINEGVGYRITLISRTVGADRIVDEMIIKFTHSDEIPWMLPGIPATGRYVELPIVVIVTFKNGKIDNEHLYWDQASVLNQIGLLESEQLPVTGAQAARNLEQFSAPA